jgi:hypothetical protein
MGWFSRKVNVTFIDDATGVAFATTKMLPNDLPASFEVNTTLHLGEADWFVVHSEPRTREGYTKSGSLVLRLRKIEMMAPDALSFSQADTTERFDDNLRLGMEDWITTTPSNLTIKNPELAGLPPSGAGPEEVYQVASKLSELRESILIPSDGVYCPICHIANIDLRKLRTPCPQCGRALLKFGWT